MLQRGVLRMEVNWGLAYLRSKPLLGMNVSNHSKLQTTAHQALMITTIEVNKMVAMLHVDVYLRQEGIKRDNFAP